MKVWHLFPVACLTGALAAAATLGPPPAWFLTAMLAIFMLGAMAYGFTGRRLLIPSWATSRPVLGVILFGLGLAAVFVPVQFVVSAFLTGSGIRLMWLSVSDLSVEAGRRDLASSGTMQTMRVRDEPHGDVTARERPSRLLP